MEKNDERIRPLVFGVSQRGRYKGIDDLIALSRDPCK
jgi:hypothetical protein